MLVWRLSRLSSGFQNAHLGRWLAHGAPSSGRPGRLILVFLITAGTVGWSLAVPNLKGIFPAVLALLQQWRTWAVMLGVGAGGTLLHEWGHVLALRVMGGRAGRILVRLGWPWAITEVGPFQEALSPWQRLFLSASGMLVEWTILGWALAGLEASPTNPVYGATVTTFSAYLAFNLFPTPWSDGGAILATAVDAVQSHMGRRTGHD